MHFRSIQVCMMLHKIMKNSSMLELSRIFSVCLYIPEWAVWQQMLLVRRIRGKNTVLRNFRVKKANLWVFGQLGYASPGPETLGAPGRPWTVAPANRLHQRYPRTDKKSHGSPRPRKCKIIDWNSCFEAVFDRLCKFDFFDSAPECNALLPGRALEATTSS